MDDLPPGPYGPMKKPSGMPNATFAAAGHRIRSGFCGVGSGTGTSTPPSGVHWRQAPLAMNDGTGARSVAGMGFGAIGTSAVATATGTARRANPGLRRAASTAYARRTAISGISARAYRVGRDPLLP